MHCNAELVKKASLSRSSDNNPDVFTAMSHVMLEEWRKKAKCWRNEILEEYEWQIMFGRFMNEKIRKNPRPMVSVVIKDQKRLNGLHP